MLLPADIHVVGGAGTKLTVIQAVFHGILLGFASAKLASCY